MQMLYRYVDIELIRLINIDSSLDFYADFYAFVGDFRIREMHAEMQFMYLNLWC